LQIKFDEELKKKKEKNSDSEEDVPEQKTKRDPMSSPDRKISKDNVNNTILQESFMISR